MRPYLLTFVALALVGCDSVAEKLFSLMSGRETSVVVLAKQPVTLSEAPSTFTSAEPMKVLGEWTSLCLVLKDGTPLQPQAQMAKIFSDALGGAKIKTALLLADGSRVTLSEPMQGWSRTGRVLPQDELSACASAGCGVKLPNGALVKAVEVSSSPPVKVRGVFWQSEQDLTKRPLPANSSTVAQSAGDQSRCRASS